MTAEEEKELLDQEKANDREALTIRLQMKTYRYKTQRDLFLNMSACSITKKSNGIIRFSPSNHERLKRWSGDGFAESDYATVEEPASDRALGERLQHTLSRCKSSLA